MIKSLVVTILLSLSVLFLSCSGNKQENVNTSNSQKEITISKQLLLDKIKGGWAGQVIGCTYGGPTEFKYNGTMINDYLPIPWDDDRMKWYFNNAPGLYDDVYMDLTFVEVFEKYGLDVADSLHALAFANAAYPLWHANQAARYNILNGIMPPSSGYWKYNPHADDIDFQIEADFAGLMSPGMPNTASQIANRIGHIMNYGDGVYGGVYVASMYALAFFNTDIAFVVTEALKSIPPQSQFYQCIADVIKWHKQYPTDWKSTWFETQKKWSDESGCPDGVFKPFNIDAKINSAYIVIGLLYGQSDFGKTIDISTRCGFDSDCNPASSGGILGVLIGYDKIPSYWKNGLTKVDDINFPYTSLSLNKLYQVGLKHAVTNIVRNGGGENGDMITIANQQLQSVPFEIAFEGIYPQNRDGIWENLSTHQPAFSFPVNGSGFVITGSAFKEEKLSDVILEIDVLVDNVVVERAKLPTNWLKRRHEVTWRYDLAEGNHTIEIKAINIPQGYQVKLEEVITYTSSKPGRLTYF